ncbi:nuclear transport factor 2 family protein, partial [Kitasatospora sp. NPDC004799]|uniref:nuclear transport factor 2 family protein n=1 Tax=Kitasatospora sp. NPDC004799 TaxID=3154460 RepID=UPI0033A52174
MLRGHRIATRRQFLDDDLRDPVEPEVCDGPRQPVFVGCRAQQRLDPALGAAQVRRYYQLVDAGDVPALVALFTPD